MKTIKAHFASRTAKLFLSIAVISMFFMGCSNNNSPTNNTPALTKAVYVANEDDGTISVIDADKGVVVKTIDLMDGKEMYMAHNVQVAPNGKTTWVTAMPMTDGASDQIIVINTADYSIKTRINTGAHQHLAHVVLDDNSTFAYAVANEGNKVFKIDASQFTIVKSYDFPDSTQPHGLRYKDGKLYVACMGSKSIAVIDVNAGTISYVQLGGIAVQTAVTQDGKYVFASLYDTKQIAVYNIQTGQLAKVDLPNVAQGPIQMYPTPDSKSLYICDQGETYSRPASNKVYVYDIAGQSITQTITVGNAAHGVVVNNDGSKAYITNKNDNTVSVINISTNSVEKTIPVGEQPNGVSYWYSVNGVTAGMK